MSAPLRTAARPDRPLAVAAMSEGDIGSARRGAALALVAAVLVGSCGVALAATAVFSDAWAIGSVVVSAALAGVLLAATAWRKGFC
jgi:protein-S-isoprenylcysteine O-methyltransferase Ste14